MYIIIPVFNRKEFTRNCLNALRAHANSDLHIIVVDDGSTDGTAEMLASEFPEVEVIRGNVQLFWTASVNLGIKRALEQGAQRIMTMNNDTIAEKDFIDRMLYWSEKYPEAILGALEIDHISGKPHYGGEITHWMSNTPAFLLDRLKPEEQKGLHEVSLYPARGLLIPRAVFEKIGLFDEKRLPHYLADYDFTQQARKAGFKIFCNYDARLYTMPEESGDFSNRTAKTFKKYYKHLFDIKGGGNLRNFTIYTLKNCPPLLVPISLLSGYFRRLVGFWVK